MAALFGFVGQDMPLDDCSVAADLKLALPFQGPHPGILVLGQKQPLIWSSISSADGGGGKLKCSLPLVPGLYLAGGNSSLFHGEL